MLLPYLALAGQGGIPDWIHWVIMAGGMILTWFLKSPLVPSITNVVAKAFKILDAILEARHPDSPGGKEITTEEWENDIFPKLQLIGDLLKPILGK